MTGKIKASDETLLECPLRPPYMPKYRWASHVRIDEHKPRRAWFALKLAQVSLNGEAQAPSPIQLTMLCKGDSLVYAPDYRLVRREEAVLLARVVLVKGSGRDARDLRELSHGDIGIAPLGDDLEHRALDPCPLMLTHLRR
jgi:hypothetical protein